MVSRTQSPSSTVGPGGGVEGAVGHFYTEHRETDKPLSSVSISACRAQECGTRDLCGFSLWSYLEKSHHPSHCINPIRGYFPSF